MRAWMRRSEHSLVGSSTDTPESVSDWKRVSDFFFMVLVAPTTGFFTENAKKWMARNFFSWANARLSDSDSQLFTARKTGHCVTIKETLSVPQLRRMYRFLFRIWCFVRQHCVQICNRKERKQLWHKLDLRGSYLGNVCSI